MQAWIRAVCNLAAAQPLASRGRRVQPAKDCWGQRALCGVKGHGDGDSHWSGAGNGEDVMFSKGLTLSGGCK